MALRTLLVLFALSIFPQVVAAVGFSQDASAGTGTFTSDTVANYSTGHVDTNATVTVDFGPNGMSNTGTYNGQTVTFDPAMPGTNGYGGWSYGTAPDPWTSNDSPGGGTGCPAEGCPTTGGGGPRFTVSFQCSEEPWKATAQVQIAPSARDPWGADYDFELWDLRGNLLQSSGIDGGGEPKILTLDHNAEYGFTVINRNLFGGVTWSEQIIRAAPYCPPAPELTGVHLSQDRSQVELGSAHSMDYGWDSGEEPEYCQLWWRRDGSGDSWSLLHQVGSDQGHRYTVNWLPGTEHTYVHTGFPTGTGTYNFQANCIRGADRPQSVEITMTIINNKPPAVASCYPLPKKVAVNQPVTWYAHGSGGDGSYTYDFKGDDGVNSNGAYAKNTYNTYYTTPGTKNVWASVASGGTFETKHCDPLTVTPVPPPTVDLWHSAYQYSSSAATNQSNISAGWKKNARIGTMRWNDDLVINWTAYNATKCISTNFATGDATTGYDYGPAYPGYNKSVPYNIRCYGLPGADPAYADRSVIITRGVPPATVTLTADPVRVRYGEDTNLTWTTARAKNCVASSDPTGLWIGSKASNTGDTPGSRTDNGIGPIIENSIFRLLCQHTDTDQALPPAQATVGVISCTTGSSFSVSSTLVPKGSTVTASCQTGAANPVSCFIKQGTRVLAQGVDNGDYSSSCPAGSGSVTITTDLVIEGETQLLCECEGTIIGDPVIKVLPEFQET